MNSENTQLANPPQKRLTLKSYLSEDVIRKKFTEVLGERAPQFLSALVQVGSDDNLRGCTPQSIAASAMTAATLDLPIQKSLGFAWIVPYKGDASFQIGYKGVIQLALRTGQFKGINAENINAEAYKGRDEIGDPIIDWNEVDETKPAVGYAIAWRLVNGFTKVVYWSKEKVIAHAQKFSQSYRGQRNSPWKTDFDAMALKTVVKNALGKWAPLTVKLQEAFLADNTRRKDLDSEPEMIDLDPNGDRVEPEDKPKFIEPESEQNGIGERIQGTTAEPLYQDLFEKLKEDEITLPELVTYLKEKNAIKKTATVLALEEINSGRVEEVLKDWNTVRATIKG